MRKVSVSDCTLRELCKKGGVRLLFREKLAASRCMDRYGADVIELPDSDITKRDKIVCRTICESVSHAVVAIPVGDSIQSVHDSYNLISGALKPRLQVVLPVSTVGMEYQYRLKGPAMISLISSLVSEAKSLCGDVEFQALDSARCHQDFLIEACKAAKEAGSSCITVFDDEGTMMPDDTASLVKLLKAETGLMVNVSVSNALGMGNACALYAVMAGADGVRVSCAGTGGLSLDSFADLIKAKGPYLGVCTSLDYTKIHSDINSMMGGLESAELKTDDFSAKNASDILLDSSSTPENVADAAKKLGYELSGNDINTIFNSLMKLCEKKSSIGRKEFEAIIATESMQVPETYHLVSYVATISNTCSGVANIILDRNGETLSGSASGDGVVDCAFRAIEKCIGCRYELDDFQILSVTEGREALGSALVRLRSGGKLYSGSGLSQDICGASINAYISALNKIASEEHRL